MPFYEYQCHACGEQFEIFQRIVEPPLKECPHCNQDQIERLISSTSFLLKGGGWYKDGYGSKGGNHSDGKATISKKEEVSSAPKEASSVEEKSTQSSLSVDKTETK